ncbi:MAG: hypothetical protein MZW92_12065 [Comamonadaceae bacterium]|nr:hypothetical protein [Comamonadaceae bacterium]
MVEFLEREPEVEPMLRRTSTASSTRWLPALRARQPQLPHRGDRLHRRAATARSTSWRALARAPAPAAPAHRPAPRPRPGIGRRPCSS